MDRSRQIMTQITKTATVQKASLARTAYTVSEVANSVGCSERTIQREIHTGKLRCVRISKRLMVTASALDDYLKKCLVKVG